MKSLIESSSLSSVAPYHTRLLQISLNAAKDDWYKIIAEGLRVLSCVVTVMRPITSYDDNEMDIVYRSNELHLDTTIPIRIFDSIYHRLEAVDIDLEIKECSIIAIGKLFSHMGDFLYPQLSGILSILRKRIDNEITRTSTLRTILEISKSPLKLDVSQFINESAKDLALFLRQQNRSLKLSTIQTLDALFRSSSYDVPDINSIVSIVLKELSPLVSDSDSSLTLAAFKLTLTILEKFPESINDVILYLYQSLVKVAKSCMVQGLAFQSLIDVYKALSLSKHPSLTYTVLFNDLYANHTEMSSTNKISFLKVAKVIAAISKNT